MRHCGVCMTSVAVWIYQVLFFCAVLQPTFLRDFQHDHTLSCLQVFNRLGRSSHSHVVISHPMVWFGCHTDHAMMSPLWKKRVLLLLADTGLLSFYYTHTGRKILKLPVGPAHFVLAAQACSLLLPLESESTSVAPVIWPNHPFFIYSSLSVAFHFWSFFFFPQTEVITHYKSCYFFFFCFPILKIGKQEHNEPPHSDINWHAALSIHLKPDWM